MNSIYKLWSEKTECDEYLKTNTEYNVFEDKYKANCSVQEHCQRAELLAAEFKYVEAIEEIQQAKTFEKADPKPDFDAKIREYEDKNWDKRKDRAGKAAKQFYTLLNRETEKLQLSDINGTDCIKIEPANDETLKWLIQDVLPYYELQFSPISFSPIIYDENSGIMKEQNLNEAAEQYKIFQHHKLTSERNFFGTIKQNVGNLNDNKPMIHILLNEKGIYLIPQNVEPAFGGIQEWRNVLLQCRLKRTTADVKLSLYPETDIAPKPFLMNSPEEIKYILTIGEEGFKKSGSDYVLTLDEPKNAEENKIQELHYLLKWENSEEDVWTADQGDYRYKIKKILTIENEFYYKINFELNAFHKENGEYSIIKKDSLKDYSIGIKGKIQMIQDGFPQPFILAMNFVDREQYIEPNNKKPTPSEKDIRKEAKEKFKDVLKNNASPGFIPAVKLFVDLHMTINDQDHYLHYKTLIFEIHKKDD